MDHNTVQAFEILKEDHRQLGRLFRQFREAKTGSVALAQKICQELLIHLRLEEQLFYVEARNAWQGRTMPLDEAHAEHASIRHIIEQVDGMNADDPMLAASIKVLEEQVEHHLHEEENELMPAIGRLNIDFENLAFRMRSVRENLRALISVDPGKMGQTRDCVCIPTRFF